MNFLETTISQLLNKILMIQKHFHRTENMVFVCGYIMNKLNNNCGNPHTCHKRQKGLKQPQHPTWGNYGSHS